MFEFELCLCCSLPAELSSLSRLRQSVRLLPTNQPIDRSPSLSHSLTTCTLFRLTRFAFVFVSLLLVFLLATSFSYTFARSLLSPFASLKCLCFSDARHHLLFLFPFFVGVSRSFGDRSCHSFPRCARFGAFPAIKALPKLTGVKRKEIFPVFFPHTLLSKHDRIPLPLCLNTNTFLTRSSMILSVLWGSLN